MPGLAWMMSNLSGSRNHDSYVRRNAARLSLGGVRENSVGIGVLTLAGAIFIASAHRAVDRWLGGFVVGFGLL